MSVFDDLKKARKGVYAEDQTFLGLCLGGVLVVAIICAWVVVDGLLGKPVR